MESRTAFLPAAEKGEVTGKRSAGHAGAPDENYEQPARAFEEKL